LLCFSHLLFSQDVYLAVVLERASIDNKNSILLTDNTVIFEINKLGRAVTAHVLACHTSMIATSEPVTTALQIYTKLLCKESCLIGNMISGIFQQVSVSNEIGSHPDSSPVHASSGAGAIPQKAVMSLLHDAAQLAQTVAEGISFLRSIHSASFSATDKHLGVSSSSVSVAATLTGGAQALSPRHENGAALQYQYGYYYCTALFLHSCTEMLRLLCLLVNIEDNKIRKEGMPGGIASELNRLRLRVFHSLHGSLPTTEELHCELRVLQFYRPDAHTVATEARLLEMVQQLHPFGSDILPQYSLSSNNNNDLLSDEKHLSFGTLRLRYIVFGAKSLFNVLQYMQHHTDALPSWSPPSTEKWVNQLAEVVLLMLNGGRVPNLCTPSGKQLVYGPYFVQLLSSLLSQLSVSSLSLPAIRWIFWDLAKVREATLRYNTKVVVCP
jgi:hypothetical protein